MEKASNHIDSLIEIICNVMLVLMTLIVTYVVFMRYVLNDTPVWGEELVRTLLVWLTFLGAGIGLKRDSHIKLTIIDGFLSPKFLKLVEWSGIIVLILFSLVLIFQGINMTILSSGNRMSGLGIPTSWLVACIPIAGVLYIFQLINNGRNLK